MSGWAIGRTTAMTTTRQPLSSVMAGTVRRDQERRGPCVLLQSIRDQVPALYYASGTELFGRETLYFRSRREMDSPVLVPRQTRHFNECERRAVPEDFGRLPFPARPTFSVTIVCHEQGNDGVLQPEVDSEQRVCNHVVLDWQP